MKALLVAATLVLAASTAESATYTTTFEQVGADIVATGAGSFDLTGMSLSFPVVPEENRIWSALDFFLFGSGDGSGYDLTMSGPAGFGTGAEVLASSWSGDQVGIWAELNRIYVPVGYASGAALSNSATWSGQTLADLGLSIGTYVYSFGNNTYNIVVSDSIAPVPVAPALPLLASALGLMAFVRRRRSA